MSAIRERVYKIIAYNLVIETSEVRDEAELKQDLGADSIDLAELIMEFEREFEVSIPSKEAKKLKTVRDVITYLDLNM